jgi:metal-sulfur cluster biosynthetic enzyme
MTLTTRACPLGGLIVEEAREHLQRRFRDVPSIDVSLVWDPPWSPHLITERGRELLGHSPRSEI